MPGLKFASLPLKCGEKNQQQQEMGWKVEQGKEFIDFIKDLIGPGLCGKPVPPYQNVSI